MIDPQVYDFLLLVCDNTDIDGYPHSIPMIVALYIEWVSDWEKALSNSSFTIYLMRISLRSELRGRRSDTFPVSSAI
jgi:hypothetical protein